MIALVGGTVLTPSRQIPDGAVLVEGNRIVVVGPRQLVAIPTHAEVIDVSDSYLAPGFVDLHCHGAIGVDFNRPGTTPDDLHRVAAFKASHGTTSFLAAIATASPEATERSLDVVHRSVGAREGAEVLGAQAEGPFLNPAAAGAQAVECIRPPDLAELDRWLAVCPELRLISVAPEMEGGLEFIAEGHRRGITLSVGHSCANYDQVIAAVGVGLTHATHTFNAMQGFHHRHPGTAGAVLTCDEITAEAVVDNVHLHPAAVNLLVRCKGPSRLALITDAMSAAGLPEGEHEWDGRRVTVADGAVRLDDGTIAGSTLTMDRALRNLVAAAEIPLADAVQMATLNPARSIGVHNRKGSLACGRDADVVVLDRNLEVDMTMVRGAIVFRREKDAEAV
ncbi:MAG: N-acetylglucosamine-6-phosphate deacetylase [Anaerolineae bacterium]|nr:N-acetylglucosamine-6-phosphate deacetylase [Anaerolineae bacterium]